MAGRMFINQTRSQITQQSTKRTMLPNRMMALITSIGAAQYSVAKIADYWPALAEEL